MAHFQDQLPRGCRLITLPHIVDERGELSFAEGGNHIPFEIKRIFWTYGVKDDCSRGNHAHRTCAMVLFPVGGSYEIDLDDSTTRHSMLMKDPHIGLLIPPGVWCSLHHFSSNAACVCLASHPYEAEDYIHNYDEFLAIVRK